MSGRNPITSYGNYYWYWGEYMPAEGIT